MELRRCEHALTRPGGRLRLPGARPAGSRSKTRPGRAARRAGEEGLCGLSSNGIAPLSLGEWEELHTRTLDLNPPAAPYVGYQIWGDSYQRGAFLAKMNRALVEAGVDSGRRAARPPGPSPALPGAARRTRCLSWSKCSTRRSSGC